MYQVFASRLFSCCHKVPAVTPTECTVTIHLYRMNIDANLERAECLNVHSKKLEQR